MGRARILRPASAARARALPPSCCGSSARAAAAATTRPPRSPARRGTPSTTRRRAARPPHRLWSPRRAARSRAHRRTRGLHGTARARRRSRRRSHGLRAGHGMHRVCQFVAGADPPPASRFCPRASLRTPFSPPRSRPLPACRAARPVLLGASPPCPCLWAVPCAGTSLCRARPLRARSFCARCSPPSPACCVPYHPPAGWRLRTRRAACPRLLGAPLPCPHPRAPPHTPPAPPAARPPASHRLLLLLLLRVAPLCVHPSPPRAWRAARNRALCMRGHCLSVFRRVAAGAYCASATTGVPPLLRLFAASSPCRTIRYLSGRAARARVRQVLFVSGRLPQPAAFARIGHNAVARVAGLGVVEVPRWRTSFYFNSRSLRGPA